MHRYPGLNTLGDKVAGNVPATAIPKMQAWTQVIICLVSTGNGALHKQVRHSSGTKGQRPIIPGSDLWLRRDSPHMLTSGDRNVMMHTLETPVPSSPPHKRALLWDYGQSLKAGGWVAWGTGLGTRHTFDLQCYNPNPHPPLNFRCQTAGFTLPHEMVQPANLQTLLLVKA